MRSVSWARRAKAVEAACRRAGEVDSSEKSSRRRRSRVREVTVETEVSEARERSWNMSRYDLTEEVEGVDVVICGGRGRSEKVGGRGVRAGSEGNEEGTYLRHVRLRYSTQMRNHERYTIEPDSE